MCADCGAEKDVQWASINFGVTLCIECGGIHRSLGVHVTKVRSITLDMWEPEILKVMAELGNSIVNSILENQVGDREKPSPDSMRGVKEVWVTDKYKNRTFVNTEVFSGREAEEAEAWTVKRLRRRARKVREGGGKEAMDREEKDVDTCLEDSPQESSLLESVMRASTLGPVSRVLNAEVCLFGGSLGKHHVASLELDSDQESTDGEGEDSWAAPTDRISLLSPDLLLFRAAAAHNVPVMCQVCHVLCVTCYVSRVMYHVVCITCYVSCVRPWLWGPVWSGRPGRRRAGGSLGCLLGQADFLHLTLSCLHHTLAGLRSTRASCPAA